MINNSPYPQAIRPMFYGCGLADRIKAADFVLRQWVDPVAKIEAAASFIPD
ncbi:MAG: hypothetical protein Q4A62_06095 [Eikenella sp.]|nr:hypothetical protein [Eikenella sp.]